MCKIFQINLSFWDNMPLSKLLHRTTGFGWEICDLREQRVHDRNFTGREKVSQQEHESANRAKRKHWTAVRHAKIPHPEVLNMRTHTHTTLTYLRKHDLTSFLFAYRCSSVRAGESGVVSDGLPWWFSSPLMILTKQMYVNRKERGHFRVELC